MSSQRSKDLMEMGENEGTGEMRKRKECSSQGRSQEELERMFNIKKKPVHDSSSQKGGGPGCMTHGKEEERKRVAKMEAALDTSSRRQHGPAQTDHMAEKVRWPGYYEMRNQLLKESGKNLREGNGFTNTSVYKALSEKICGTHGTENAGMLASHSSSSLSLSSAWVAAERKKDTSTQAAGPSSTSSSSLASKGVGDEPCQIFRGVVAYMNGKTGSHSAMHLTKLIQQHGGECSWTFGKRSCTHVVCENLSGAKTEKALTIGAKGVHVSYVRPAWVEDSIRARRRLPEARYLSVKDPSSRSLDSFFSSKQAS